MAPVLPQVETPNGRTSRTPAAFGKFKQDNALSTYDQDNFKLTNARSRNRALDTDVKDMYTSTVPPPIHVYINQLNEGFSIKIGTRNCWCGRG